jgi:hypothetical protein
MTDNNSTIVAQLAELIASLDRQGTETRAGLRELIDNGTQHVAGSEYAGITLAEKGKVITNVVATHRYPVVLDVIQNEHGEGPLQIWRSTDVGRAIRSMRLRTLRFGRSCRSSCSSITTRRPR